MNNSNYNILYIQSGPCDGEVVYKCYDSNEKKHFFIKTWLQNAQDHIKWFKWAAKEGIGVPITEVPNGIKMPAGLRLAEAVEKKYILHDEVEFQLNLIKDRLKEEQTAHCDVKYDNCMFFVGWGVRLIDNGDMSRYGEFRPVKTPGLNTTVLLQGQIPGQAGPGTDEKGFEKILEQLDKNLGK